MSKRVIWCSFAVPSQMRTMCLSMFTDTRHVQKYIRVFSIPFHDMADEILTQAHSRNATWLPLLNYFASMLLQLCTVPPVLDFVFSDIYEY